MRRAGVVWLGHETIAGLLRLTEGQVVRSINADWLRCGIGVEITGADLPEVPEAELPPSIQPAGYVDLELRPKIEALLQRYYDVRDGPDSSDVLALIKRTLAGEYDPRIDMPEELYPGV
jgi:hypothetical protein